MRALVWVESLCRTLYIGQHQVPVFGGPRESRVEPEVMSDVGVQLQQRPHVCHGGGSVLGGGRQLRAPEQIGFIVLHPLGGLKPSVVSLFKGTSSLC